MTFPYIRFVAPCLIFAATIFVSIDSAQAYVGPGLGVGALAVVLGVIVSVLLAIFAIVWYPLKRMLKKRKVSAKTEGGQTKK